MGKLWVLCRWCGSEKQIEDGNFDVQRTCGCRLSSVDRLPRHLSFEARAAILARAKEVGTPQAALEACVSTRTIARWRNGHFKKAGQLQSAGQLLAAKE